MKQLFFVKKCVISIIIFCSFSPLAAQHILLTWDPNSDTDVKFYSVYRASATQDETLVAQIPGDNSSFQDYDIVRGELYYYRITATDFAYNESEFSQPVQIVADITSFSDSDADMLPHSFELKQNYPNPFNPTTHFEYAVAEQSFVTLNIYDVLGRKVKTLVDGTKTAGFYKVTWDGSDAEGNNVASGLYFAQFVAGDFRQVRKITLQK